MKTLVVIPAFNEEGSLQKTVSDLKETIPDIDFVVVNDGSRDGTLAICRENNYPVLNLPVNLGLTAAFQTGMKYAFGHGYDYVLQFDADGQHRPEYIMPMLSRAEAESADVVIGSRFVEEKKHISARMAGSSLIKAFIRLTTGRTINDPTSGMRLYGKDVIEKFANGYDYAPEPDTVALLLRNGAKASEVQVTMQERQAGESYLSFTKSISYMMRTCASILFLQWFR